MPAERTPRASMTVIDGTGALGRALGRVVAVVGVFDGLHRGHEYLLGELRRLAAGHDARPMVITFDHHPDEILKGAAPPLLCDPDERLDRLAAAGVEITVIETFDRALRETPYDVWVRRITNGVEVAAFLMTPESAFGYERRGTPETVAALGREVGYEVTVVPQFTLDGKPVRSSDIRAAIAAGDFAGAEPLLGRPYAVAGRGVEAGVTRVAMTFELPIALPGAGEYDVAVEFPDGSRPWPAGAIIDEDGALTLATIPFQGPARVIFRSDGTAGPCVTGP
jgi:riboflavin kinase / FMN adenylyltransferase